MSTMNTVRFKMDEEWHDVPEGVDSFGPLKKWVEGHFKERGLVLLGTLHGEASLTLDEADAWHDRPLSELDTVEFLSADPDALARRTCSDMRDFLDQLAERAEQTAREIDNGQMDKALVGVKECAEGWSLVLQAYRDLLDLSGTESSTVEMDGRPLSAVANDLKGLIESMGEELKRSDMSGLKSLLVDDLILYVEPLREGFERVQEKFA